MLFPEAPAIGGDAYEVENWLQKVVEYYEAIEGGQAHEDEVMMAPDTILRAFQDANPEVV